MIERKYPKRVVVLGPQMLEIKVFKVRAHTTSLLAEALANLPHERSVKFDPEVTDNHSLRGGPCNWE